jgi:hypothetical protein
MTTFPQKTAAFIWHFKYLVICTIILEFLGIHAFVRTVKIYKELNIQIPELTAAYLQLVSPISEQPIIAGFLLMLTTTLLLTWAYKTKNPTTELNFNITQ